MNNKQKVTAVIGLLALAAALVWFVYMSGGYNKPSPGVKIGDKTIQVEIADTPSERRQGLSGRSSLAPDRGMLFVFPAKQVRTFWMPNMHFGLDMLWISDNKIVNITKNASPGGENPDKRYSSELPVNYVLEVNSGFADKHNIQPGDKVQFHFN